MAWHWLKRWLFLTHRWIGIVTCLLFAVWFASGVVMVHVPFPSLERAEWLAGQRPIDWAQVRTAPPTADQRQVALEMRGGEPVWRGQAWSGERSLVSARDGRVMEGADAAEARATAEMFGGAPLASLESIHNDQWSVAGGFDRHRPLWKASLTGDMGRIVYVSSSDGSVVLDTHRSERFWNWLGSVPHWIYFTSVRENQPLWRQVVIWLSFPCIIAAITGMWIGLMRIRPGRKRFKGGRVIPYRGWMAWHHWAGLIGGLMLVLWIFSGWLSVDPGRYFEAGEGPAVERQIAYAGPLGQDLDLARLAALAPQAQRITLGSAAGRAFVRVEQDGSPARLLDARTLAPLAFDPARIAAALPALVPDVAIASVHLLRQPDAHWYTVRGDLPLPVLRARLADDADTWLHIDPASGEVLGASDDRRRLYRWLFDLFHRWDANVLLQQQPLREVLIWLFSIAGMVTSVSGIWIGWKRLRKPKPRSSPA
jgi:uncharacterized iron-regulated membrane protein